MTLRPVVLTVAGSDSGGGAGIQADTATFLALGVHGTTAITALTAQSGSGIRGIHRVPPAFVAEQVLAVCAGYDVAAAKTGMLSDEGTVRAVAGAVRDGGITNLVVDPVIASTSGTVLLNPAGIGALVEDLLPLALVLTPNLDEAAVLTGKPVRDLGGMRAAAETLRGWGARWVLVKGGHLPGRAVDVLAGPGGITELEAERVESTAVQGTGCVLSAAIAAYLGRGVPVPDAVARAKEHVTGAIRNGVLAGPG
ncbi:MAG TPA: bifunctional hydroxymethylpyrimidine kinase/phosphomethylpyrimidine kinase, partial [Acidimicrobiales bacterium]|nr:bifunctional hydroxymethylpyrimidine kinase/phosphomethylpyrimidine kinase [Acidimicrobiales bacterium]